MVDIKTADLKTCPYLNKKCIADKCMMWVSYQKSDDTVLQTCTFVLTPLLLSQVIVEQARNQASTDKVANEVVNGFDNLVAMARFTQKKALADGNAD